jgi:hypothetical protein
MGRLCVALGGTRWRHVIHESSIPDCEPACMSANATRCARSSARPNRNTSRRRRFDLALSSSPDAALFRAMVKGRLSPCSKVCEECHASRPLFSNRTVARHRRGFRSKHAAAYARRGKSLPRRRAPLLQRCPLRRIPGGILPAGASQSRQSRLPLGFARPRSVKHEPERWIGVFRKDHAQTKAGAGRPIR